jgi:hypothetical protein
MLASTTTRMILAAVCARVSTHARLPGYGRLSGIHPTSSWLTTPHCAGLNRAHSMTRRSCRCSGWIRFGPVHHDDLVVVTADELITEGLRRRETLLEPQGWPSTHRARQRRSIQTSK